MAEPKITAEELERIELRSQEVQQIMGHIPPWVIRRGITTIAIIIFTLLVGSWFFKYPDLIRAPIVVTTENPPAVIVARNGGKIQPLLVVNNQQVKSGDCLAIIENAADYPQVLNLKTQLRLQQGNGGFTKVQFLPPLGKLTTLGDLQSGYELFYKSYEDLSFMLRERYQDKRLAAIRDQISQHQALTQRLAAQVSIQFEEFKLSNQQFERGEVLFKEGVISQSDFDSMKSGFLQKQGSFESAKANLAQQQIQISQLQQNLVDATWQYSEERKRLELQLNEAYKNLASQVAQWEYRYQLSTPINGQVTFAKYWGENQNVVPGEVMFKIIPGDSSKIIGIIRLPIEGSGKVKSGQRVSIQFANYPHMEYGMVSGSVRKKSLAPAENSYLAEVILPHGLVTNYKKRLPFSQELQGTAEITTEDIRLLVRIFDPLRSLFKKHLDPKRDSPDLVD